MSVGKHIAHLIDDITLGRIGENYLKQNNWKEVNTEALAQYFVLTNKHFNSIKRIIQFVSGSIILLQNSSLGSNKEVFYSLSFAKNLLDETIQEIREIHIPKELKRHHQHLIDSIHFLNVIFGRFVLVERILYLNKDQIENILFLLKSANEKLKIASSFEMGLEMVDLNSSCACGH